MRPHRQQPTRLPRPWDSPDKNTGVGCHFLLQCRKVKSESDVAQLCPTLSDPMDCSPPGPSVHGIFPPILASLNPGEEISRSLWQNHLYYTSCSNLIWILITELKPQMYFPSDLTLIYTAILRGLWANHLKVFGRCIKLSILEYNFLSLPTNLLSQPMIGVHVTEPQGEGCWVGPQTHAHRKWMTFHKRNGLIKQHLYNIHLPRSSNFLMKRGVIETGLIRLLASCQNPSGGPNFLVQQGLYVHGQSRSGPGRRTAMTDSRCYNGFS